MHDGVGGPRKIGLIGGSFDPIHNGHLIIARDAAERLGLSEVVFIPAHVPPHKRGQRRASPEHRLEMCGLATRSESDFSVSDMEIARGGVSFTFDTVRAVSAAHPSANIVLIIGGDTLVDLHNWRNVDGILELCDVATFARPGDDDPNKMAEKMELPPRWKERLLANVFTARLIEISSSEIRDRVAQGLNVSYLVPPAVDEYIVEHDLYKN